MYSRRHFIGIIMLTLIIIVIVLLVDVPKVPDKPDVKKFPKELVDPCVGKEIGDVCVIEDFRGTEESTCQDMGGTLVCFSHGLPPLNR